MTLASGTKLGPYEIASPLGAGGMGEVYRARDTRLDREVAIKVLPESFARDADRLWRFEQEARTVAALNHPNILPRVRHRPAPGIAVHGLRASGWRGATRKIPGSPMPQRRAMDYASQIAEGLAAAHDKGVVHRDLKPENVFVTKDGRVKVLAFGLAKLARVHGSVDV
jgi:serine/threonine protein kinase